MSASRNDGVAIVGAFAHELLEDLLALHVVAELVAVDARLREARAPPRRRRRTAAIRGARRHLRDALVELERLLPVAHALFEEGERLDRLDVLVGSGDSAIARRRSTIAPRRVSEAAREDASRVA